MGVYIIAEAGVNHNGSLELAKRLCDAAKDAGADAIKFQTWITERIITKHVEQADYQRKNLGNAESQYSMLKKLELSYDDFKKIKNYCDFLGIDFASTADEETSLDFLINLGIKFIKVGSGDIGNISYLRYIGSKNLPVILSTGMSSLADVDISVQALIEGGGRDITILHCTTDYPCEYKDVNLKAINTLREAFKLDVGYSDHTIGAEISIAAVACGAKVIEKHFTLDRNMNGPDHLASMEPSEFKRMVRSIRNVEAAIGDGIKKPTNEEKDISQVIFKRIVAKENIICGEEFSVKNITTKRNDSGIPAAMWDYIIGSKAVRNYKEDEGITF